LLRVALDILLDPAAFDRRMLLASQRLLDGGAAPANGHPHISSARGRGWLELLSPPQNKKQKTKTKTKAKQAREIKQERSAKVLMPVLGVFFFVFCLFFFVFFFFCNENWKNKLKIN
jgi:hypothetical protein